MENELLKILAPNISVVDKPDFYWDGNSVTDDETAEHVKVATYTFSETFNFLDFIKANSDKKIVLLDGKLSGEYSGVRAFVSN